MKKNVFMIVLLACVVQWASAQEAGEATVYLRNGSIVKGKLTYVDDDQMKVDIPNGSVIFFSRQDIKRMTRSEGGAVSTSSASSGKQTAGDSRITNMTVILDDPEDGESGTDVRKTAAPATDKSRITNTTVILDDPEDGEDAASPASKATASSRKQSEKPKITNLTVVMDDEEVVKATEETEEDTQTDKTAAKTYQEKIDNLKAQKKNK